MYAAVAVFHLVNFEGVPLLMVGPDTLWVTTELLEEEVVELVLDPDVVACKILDST